MNRVAALMAVSWVFLVAGCSPERPMSDVARSSTADGAQRPASATPAEELAADAIARNAAGEVRDAKEAAEDAARRILDATVSAAARLREAGRGAAEAVGLAEDRDKVADAAPVDPDAGMGAAARN
tara:strand:- start:2575 stop:2952 length:378 start_codon:yes stop_codon:yes gene_type:complete